MFIQPALLTPKVRSWDALRQPRSHVLQVSFQARQPQSRSSGETSAGRARLWNWCGFWYKATLIGSYALSLGQCAPLPESVKEHTQSVLKIGAPSVFGLNTALALVLLVHLLHKRQEILLARGLGPLLVCMLDKTKEKQAHACPGLEISSNWYHALGFHGPLVVLPPSEETEFQQLIQRLKQAEEKGKLYYARHKGERKSLQRHYRKRAQMYIAGVMLEKQLRGHHPPLRFPLGERKERKFLYRSAVELARLERASWDPAERKRFIRAEIRGFYRGAQGMLGSPEPEALHRLYEAILKQLKQGKSSWTGEELWEMLLAFEIAEEPSCNQTKRKTI